jgi:anion-transporting  ArsA/GET3 family ATPase
VGKSSVAAAVALAASRTGRQVCLVEIEGRQTFSRLFDSEPWGFAEREVRPGVFGLSIDPEASLAEYLAMFYGARRISRLVVGSTAVEFATTAAPGLKDVLLIGKVREMERRRDEDGRFHYDLIVVDAPPTGRIVRFLRAPEATTELVHIGPIHTQAQSVVDMLLDHDRTCALLVTLYEEMPVTETIESAAALGELGVAIGPVIANRVRAERFDENQRRLVARTLKPGRLVTLLDEAGLAIERDDAASLLARGREELERLALQDAMRQMLTRELSPPAIELPELFSDEFGPAEIARLAEHVEEAWE